MLSELEIKDIESAALSLNFEKLKNKTILISGGTGFIGTYITHIIRYHNEKFNDNIHIISLSRSGGISDSTIECIKCDINKEIVLDKHIDYIIHLASNTHPKQYAEDPVGTITTNVLGCINLLNLGVKNNIDRFLLASSVEIYGQCKETPADENYSGYIDCNTARAGYNEAKRLCESLCQSYKSQYNVNFVTARLSRIIGPDRKKDTKAIAQFIDKAINNEDIILKSKGNQLYSYTYVSDAAVAILKLLCDGENSEAYNVSAENDGMTLGDYAKYIADLSHRIVIFEIENNDSVSKATYALLDNSKLKSIGWNPRYEVKEAIEMTYKIKKELQVKR